MTSDRILGFTYVTYVIMFTLVCVIFCFILSYRVEYLYVVIVNYAREALLPQDKLAS